METLQESPEFVKLSLAAAMQLNYSQARFYRAARMTCINLLLTYARGCAANCSYCGLARERRIEGDRSFIRVTWPVKPFEDVIARIRSNQVVKRVCISMVTHPDSVDDTVTMARRLRSCTGKPVSALIAPTLVSRDQLCAIQEAGVDRIGVAFDLANEELFDRHRGKAVRGPHQWKRYWEVFHEAVGIYGRGMVGSHFIVGMGETEKEMAEAFQQVVNAGGVNHLFSFYPEEGSALEDRQPPSMGAYRRLQLACDLIDAEISRAERFQYDPEGRITHFGISSDLLQHVIASGNPFRTRGCQGTDGEVACNRPYANSLPGQHIRNFPFPPDEEDLSRIRLELEEYA